MLTYQYFNILNNIGNGMAIKTKTSLEILDFYFDLKQTTNGGGVEDWLYSNEVISPYIVNVDNDLTVVSDALQSSSTVVRVRLSSGVIGKSYSLNLIGSTNQFRVFDFTINVKIIGNRFINA